MQRQLTLSGRLTVERATDRFACLPIIVRLVTTTVFFTGIEFRFFGWIKMDSSPDQGRKTQEK